MLCDSLGVQRLATVPEIHRENRNIDVLIDLGSTGALDYIHALDSAAVFKSHSVCPDRIDEYNRRNDTYVFTIVRDPRDALVSMCFYVEAIPDGEGGHSELRSLPVPERMLRLIQWGELGLFESWSGAPSVHKFRYEELHADPRAALLAGFRNYGLGLQVTEQSLSRRSFEARSEQIRKLGRNNPIFRKGAVGDWKNYFDRNISNSFKTARDGRWNAILLGLGYESEPDWQPAF